MQEERMEDVQVEYRLIVIRDPGPTNNFPEP